VACRGRSSGEKKFVRRHWEDSVPRRHGGYRAQLPASETVLAVHCIPAFASVQRRAGPAMSRPCKEYLSTVVPFSRQAWGEGWAKRGRLISGPKPFWSVLISRLRLSTIGGRPEP
jgi:hypothetical protein